MTEYKYEYDAKRDRHNVIAREPGGEWRVLSTHDSEDGARAVADAGRVAQDAFGKVIEKLAASGGSPSQPGGQMHGSSAAVDARTRHGGES